MSVSGIDKIIIVYIAYGHFSLPHVDRKVVYIVYRQIFHIQYRGKSIPNILSIPHIDNLSIYHIEKYFVHLSYGQCDYIICIQIIHMQYRQIVFYPYVIYKMLFLHHM